MPPLRRPPQPAPRGLGQLGYASLASVPSGSGRGGNAVTGEE
jgi:hypothetical protein